MIKQIHSRFSSIQATNTTTNVLNCLAETLNEHQYKRRLGLKSYYSDNKSEIMGRLIDLLKGIDSLEIIKSNNIDSTYNNLVACWESKLYSNGPEYYRDYYSEEIMRIQARKKCSKGEKAHAFLDKS